MDLVVSLGGAVVADAVEDGDLDRYVDALADLAAGSGTLVVVPGAGPLKRYIDAADRFDAPEARKDLIGIQATRLHASLLAAALDANAEIPEKPEEVADMAVSQDVIVAGGFIPGQSTDAVAAQCAEIIDADRLVFASTVDGIYTGDPETGAAERYEEIGYDELIDLVREKEASAGGYALVDLLAAKLVQRSGLDAVVLDGRDPAILSDAASQSPPGTRIH
ncbi:MAG: UMP kinase [Candidatus Nanohaloarchaea archaeon]|nr:UMP kinase [Candidatus Nanohaloarchaea archaeon]